MNIQTKQPRFPFRLFGSSTKKQLAFQCNIPSFIICICYLLYFIYFLKTLFSLISLLLQWKQKKCIVLNNCMYLGYYFEYKSVKYPLSRSSKIITCKLIIMITKSIGVNISHSHAVQELLFLLYRRRIILLLILKNTIYYVHIYVYYIMYV